MVRALVTVAFAGAILMASVVSGFSRTSVSRTSVSRSLQTRAEMQRVPQFDNERAMSWKSIIPPHTQSTLHRHDRFRALIALSGGDLKTVTADGETTVTHLEAGKAYWNGPMPPGMMHKDVNDTDQTIEVMVVELK